MKTCKCHLFSVDWHLVCSWKQACLHNDHWLVTEQYYFIKKYLRHPSLSILLVVVIAIGGLLEGPGLPSAAIMASLLSIGSLGTSLAAVSAYYVYSRYRHGSAPSGHDHRAVDDAERGQEPEASSSTSRYRPFPFLALPLEIRRMIYRHTLGGGIYGMTLSVDTEFGVTTRQCLPEPTLCFGGRQNITYGYDDRSPLRCRRPHQGHLGLLQSCRVIHAEAIEYLYNTSAFVFNDLVTATMFVASCPEQYRRLIPHIAVDPELRGDREYQRDTWAAFCRTILEGFAGAKVLSLSPLYVTSVRHNRRDRAPIIDLEGPLMASYRDAGIRWISLGRARTVIGVVDGRELTRLPWQHFVRADLPPDQRNKLGDRIAGL